MLFEGVILLLKILNVITIVSILIVKLDCEWTILLINKITLGFSSFFFYNDHNVIYVR